MRRDRIRLSGFLHSAAAVSRTAKRDGRREQSRMRENEQKRPRGTIRMYSRRRASSSEEFRQHSDRIGPKHHSGRRAFRENKAHRSFRKTDDEPIRRHNHRRHRLAHAFLFFLPPSPPRGFLSFLASMYSSGSFFSFPLDVVVVVAAVKRRRDRRFGSRVFTDTDTRRTQSMSGDF